MIHADVAIIGAGLAGLTAAKILNDSGLSVQVFEKARGSGGRLSSKRLAIPATDGSEAQQVTFDLGATGFAVTDPNFRFFLHELEQKDKVASWPTGNKDENLFIGLPRNSAFTRSLTEALNVNYSQRITNIRLDTADQWALETEHGEVALVGRVIIAAPWQQAKDLLPEEYLANDKTFQQQFVYLKDAFIAPQWVVGLALDSGVETLLAGLPNITETNLNDLLQVSIENRKPNRTEDLVLQLQATVDWTLETLEWDREKIAEVLVASLQQAIPELKNLRDDQVLGNVVHRWLYSHVQKPLADSENMQSHVSSETGIYLSGDYFLSSGKHDGVESAFLSGKAVADEILTVI